MRCYLSLIHVPLAGTVEITMYSLQSVKGEAFTSPDTLRLLSRRAAHRLARLGRAFQRGRGDADGGLFAGDELQLVRLQELHGRRVVGMADLLREATQTRNVDPVFERHVTGLVAGDGELDVSPLQLAHGLPDGVGENVRGVQTSAQGRLGVVAFLAQTVHELGQGVRRLVVGDLHLSRVGLILAFADLRGDADFSPDAGGEGRHALFGRRSDDDFRALARTRLRGSHSM